MAETYSHSRLSTFQECPCRYKLRYIDGVRTGIFYVEAHVGNIVHGALEWLYTQIQEGNTPGEEELISWYMEAWGASEREPRIVKAGVTLGQHRDKGQRMLGQYYKDHQPFTDEQCLAVEKKLWYRTLDGNILAGVVDRISRENGRLVIHDYKTGSTLPAQEELDSDPQLGLYQLMAESNYTGTDNIELRWHYLRFNKVLTSKRTGEQLDALERDVDDMIEKINRTKTFPARTGFVCQWCEYNEICEDYRRSQDE